MFKKMPYSTRKFIRSEKARIRRQFFDSKKQQELIAELYNKILGKTPEVVKEAGAAEVINKAKEKKETKKVKKTTKKSEPKKKK